MVRRPGRWLAVLAVMVTMLGTGSTPPHRTAAQEATPPAASAIGETLFEAVLQNLPDPPAFVRLVRITLQPGASVPLHTHPGPEFGRVESGVLTVRVGGEVVIAQTTAGAAPQARVPPVSQDFELKPGDQIVYPAEVPLTFSNRTQGPVSVMTAIVLPAGENHPATAQWVDGTPGPDAMTGVNSELLGDAVAPGWPQGPLWIKLERLVLGPGQSIPPIQGPVLLSVEVGRFGFSLVEGQFQVSRGGSGPQANATPGTAVILNPREAVFFPAGMNEVPRSPNDGVLVLLRLSVRSFQNPGAAQSQPAAAAPTAAGQAPPAGSVPAQTAAPPPPTPAAPAQTPAPPPAQPTAAEPVGGNAPAQQPAPAPAANGGAALAPNTEVVVTEAGVRLRATATTEGEVVATLDQGRRLRVTGPPVEGDGIVWYPVAATDDPSVAGFIAQEYLATP